MEERKASRPSARDAFQECRLEERRLGCGLRSGAKLGVSMAACQSKPSWAPPGLGNRAS